MTALEELHEVIKILDREEREESYQAWGKKWVGQVEVETLTGDDITSPTAVAMLKEIASNLRNSILAMVAGRREAFAFEVGPGPGPRQVKLKLTLTVLLAKEAQPAAERSRIHLV